MKRALIGALLLLGASALGQESDVEKLERDVASVETSTRLLAVVDAAKVADARAVRVFSRAIDDPALEVRGAAFAGVTARSLEGSLLASLLRRFVHDPDPDIRRRAVRALHGSREIDAFWALSEAVGDVDTDVATDAVKELADVIHEDPACVPQTVIAKALRRTEDDRARMNLIYVAGEILRSKGSMDAGPLIECALRSPPWTARRALDVAFKAAERAPITSADAAALEVLASREETHFAAVMVAAAARSGAGRAKLLLASRGVSDEGLRALVFRALRRAKEEDVLVGLLELEATGAADDREDARELLDAHRSSPDLRAVLERSLDARDQRVRDVARRRLGR